MSNTQLFKNTSNNAHRKRYMTSEDQFSKGMQFTNAPLPSGYAKAIINFDLKNDGTVLTPRGGLQNINNRLDSMPCHPYTQDAFIHHADVMYVSDEFNNTYLFNYFIYGQAIQYQSGQGILINNSKLVVEVNKSGLSEYVTATYDANNPKAISGILSVMPWIHNMQDLSIDTILPRSGVYASLEGVTYVLVNFKVSIKPYTFGKIVANLNNNELFWHIEEVEPYEVQPTQAMNYGYNMLKSNPYTFINTISATGAVQLTGVLPYDEQGNLLLTARAGTPMLFKLYYKYPQIDIDNNDKYLVQWEIQDLNSNSNAEVIKKVRGSTEYTPGEDITFGYTPTYKAFSIIVRLYKKSEITAQDAAWESDQVLQKLVTKDDNLTPNQVTTLASYYLTNNSDTTMLNTAPVEYDIATATGMCTWQQRIVLWGVEGAESVLFVSEINNPGYFPYPNNCEIFTNNIIGAIAYMSSLLVFTTTALYKLTFNEDGLTYTTECVQERLNMVPEDVNTIVTVQNMVYFKSGNYFYMVVPNNQLTSQVGVQLAPVSRMLEQMFDNMNSTLINILNETYGLSINPANFYFVDYNVQVANTQIRNIYKVRLNDSSANLLRWFDISFNYDTVLRAWTIYVSETTEYRDCIYKSTVTGENILIHLFSDSTPTIPRTIANNIYVSLIQADHQNVSDTIELDGSLERSFGNWQLISTGYRDFAEDLKKRFREIQFCINILDNTVLKFNTAFVVDDVEKLPIYRLYKHTVSKITDPYDPNYGVVFVERELYNDADIPDVLEATDWELDTSDFPDITMHKVRYKVSGKGYGGAIKILSKNEVPFELLHINWVYRIMFAR